MKIDSLYVKPSGEAVVINEDGNKIAAGVLSRPSLLQLHLQVLLAVMKQEAAAWERVENGNGGGI